MANKTKILIVDDSMFQRRVLGDMLADNNFEVIQGKNGKEGIELFKNESPAIVLQDLLMPDISGIEVIKELKKLSENVKIIVLSADIQQSVKEECENLGVIRFLNKPAKEKELIEIINEALKG